MLAQPLFVFLAGGGCALIVAVTAPLWSRILVKLGKTVRHQMKEASQVIEHSLDDTDPKKEDI